LIDLSRRDGRMFRIGHRGAAALAPENTIASLALAVELGCDLVELDVVELDGALVLAHSPDELPAEPATFDEALAFLGPTGRGIHVDLKAAGTEEAIVKALRRHDVVDRSLVSTVWPRSLRTLHGLEPDLARGLTYPEDRHGLSARRILGGLVGPGLVALRSVLAGRIPRMLAAAEANIAVLHVQVVNQAVVRRCHALGVPVLAWTAQTAEEVRRLDGFGVDGVIADDPRLFES
jgi:glycerophosphoryl diester phosphodiesterase